MRLIDFRNLYLTDYNLGKLMAMNQYSNHGREFFMTKKDRETSALLYLKDSRVEYQLPSGEQILFPKGSVVYIPQGSRYQCRFYACDGEKAHTQLIEFEMTDSSGEPFACSRQVMGVLPGGVFNAFDDAIRIFRALSFSYGEFKSLLYGLLSQIAAHHQTKALHSKAFFPIAPAIRYLQKNPCTDVSIGELARMCHVSEGCFRSLFRQYSGKSPSRFCLENRMQKAEQLLQSNMYSVSEVATMVGYKDAGYFTKVFKKETGQLPSDFGVSCHPDP